MLGYFLKTRNTSQDAILFFDYEKDCEEIHPCLLLKEDGKVKDQIDFDSLSISEIQELIDYLKMRLSILNDKDR